VAPRQGLKGEKEKKEKGGEEVAARSIGSDWW